MFNSCFRSEEEADDSVPINGWRCDKDCLETFLCIGGSAKRSKQATFTKYTEKFSKCILNPILRS